MALMSSSLIDEFCKRNENYLFASTFKIVKLKLGSPRHILIGDNLISINLFVDKKN